MKTRYILAMCLFAALTGCKKDRQEVSAPQAERITIRAVLPEDQTLKGAGLKTVLSWTWNAGDKIAVVGETTEIFTIKSGFTPKVAEFEGLAVKGSSFTILYPGEGAAEADWTDQTQDGNNPMGHLRYTAALRDVDTYQSFSFNEEWAAAHAGTLAQSGVLKLTLGVPAGVKAVSAVSLSADEPIFYAGNGETMTEKLSVKTENIDAIPGESITAWMTTSWNPVTVPEGTTLYVGIRSGEQLFSRSFLLKQESILKTGVINTITLDDSGWTDETINAHYAGGKGTQASPWIIQTKEQLSYIHDDLVSGAIRYYKLDADIDMAGLDWTPLNDADPYDKMIDFDGGNHTLSNFSCSASVSPSFFGVLCGSVKDLTFLNATINGGTEVAGVVASYLGKGSNKGNCTHVTVKNATVSGTGKGIAGFAGIAGAAGTVSDCHVDGGTITQTGTESGCHAAGFLGNAEAAITLEGCTAKADISNASSYYTGGFIGQIGSAVAVNFISCGYLGGTLTAGRNAVKNSPVAGFIGRIANAGAIFTSCYVDGATIIAKTSGRCGGFVGDSGKTNIFTACSVKNSSISGAQHCGGFAGVLYCATDKCYVESTTLTAGDVNNGGFAGYPENATITDCYAVATIDGGAFNYVGGFLGLCKGGNTVTNCYEASTVTGTGTGVGAFIGYIDTAVTSITKCIAWDGSLSFHGGVKTEGLDAKITDCYTGTEGTISAKAQSFGWSTDIWDLSADMPKLK